MNCGTSSLYQSHAFRFSHCNAHKNACKNDVRFDWDKNKAAENEVRHGVGFDEAAEVFSDPYAIEVYDVEHSDFEDRYKLLGMSSLRVLLVVYTERSGDVIRLISARQATKNEEKQYEKER
ncbi:MAG: BrnT family toxin, partial [Acidobacteriota bacterium]